MLDQRTAFEERQEPGAKMSYKKKGYPYVPCAIRSPFGIWTMVAGKIEGKRGFV